MALLLGTSSVLSGQRPPVPRDSVTLSLRDARSRALRSNPELLAIQVDTAIARGELGRASVPFRFNPIADVFSGVRGAGVEAGVSQELEIFGQRGARVAARRAGMERATASVRNAVRLTMGGVDRTFYQLVAATRRLALSEEILELNGTLASIAERQLAAGEISRLDYNLAVVERGRSRARALASRRARERANLELGRLVGLPDARIVPDLDPSQHTLVDLGSLTDSAGTLRLAAVTDLALGGRADISAWRAAVREAQSEVVAARRDVLPNVLLRGISEPASDGAGRVLRPGVGFTLPLLNRNRGAIAARRAAARQAELQLTAAGIRVRTEVAVAVASYQSAAEEVDLLEQTVLGPARQNRQLLEIAYREGEVGLPVLLLIRNQVFDAELEYWDAWLEERQALAFVLEATGQNLETGAGAPAP